jgi:CheY-like chemotaxis protein
MVFSKDPEFKLVISNSAEQTIENARSLMPSLLLVDATFPQKNGFEIAAELKKSPATSTIPVVLLVGVGTKVDAQQAMAQGIAGTIAKPFGSKDFIDGIMSVLSGNKISLPEVAPAPEPAPVKAPLPPAPTPTVPTPSIPSMLQPPPLPGAAQTAPVVQMSREAIEQATRKIVEEVVWEVVPELAEKIIREELNRLLRS